MKKKMKDLLLEFDDEENIEYPIDFDYESSIKSVICIKEIIEKEFSMEFELDDQVQDASFFADIGIIEESQRIRKNNGKSFQRTYEITIRFSAFGKMVSIYSNTLNNVVEFYCFEKIIKILEENGYKYINSNELDEKYDGINKYIDENDTWWTRYFDYV